MSAYPVHDKLKARELEARTIGDFLDWLREDKRYHIAHYVKWEGYRDEHLDTVYDTPEQLIGGFLGIDPDELQREKAAMLDAIRGEK